MTVSAAVLGYFRPANPPSKHPNTPSGYLRASPLSEAPATGPLTWVSVGPEGPQPSTLCGPNRCEATHCMCATRKHSSCGCTEMQAGRIPIRSPYSFNYCSVRSSPFDCSRVRQGQPVQPYSRIPADRHYLLAVLGEICCWVVVLAPMVAPRSY